ncbi:MAG: hypothetical protein LUC89_05090 [Oscillospiraceae bacterium]|nr:hypothetical protein [Oscillospiraceae bacterium]
MGGGENIDWYDPDQIVGSGPYEVTAYESGATITLEKRDDSMMPRTNMIGETPAKMALM